MSKKLGCSITDEEKKLLDHLTKKLKKSQGELIGELIRNYQSISDRPLNPDNSGLGNGDVVISLSAFNLSASEEGEVKNALTNSECQLEEVARDGLLQRSRYLNSIAEKQASLESMTEEQMQKATFKGAANFRIEQAISTVMDHNNAQAEKSRKVCLTKGIIFKLTGSNRQTINKYFDNHQVMIGDHNHKHGLTDADNRKGKGFSFEQLLGIE